MVIETIKKNKKLFLFFALLILTQIIWIIKSDGFYFIDDSCHFNYNKHFFTDYYKETFGAWSRLGRVLLFSLPSLLGLKGIQIFSSLIFLFTILYAYKISIKLNSKNPEWIILLIGFQPVLFNISYTVLAELPAASLIVISYYYYLNKKPHITLIISSLIFLFRTEYFFVCILFAIVYLVEKKWKYLVLTITGPLLWFLHSYLVSQNPMQFFYDLGLHSRLPRISEGIDWYYYLIRFPQIFGIAQTVFFILSVVIIIQKKYIKEYSIPLLIIFGGILFHTLAALKGFNISCSIGQLRYVAVVGPVFAIISLLSLDAFLSKIIGRKQNIIISILLITFMFLSGPFVTPFHKKLVLEEESEKIAELVNKEYKGFKVLSSIHYVANALDEPKTGGDIFKELTKSNLEKYDKCIIAFLKELENDPFVGETLKLKDIENTPNIKLLYIKKEKVNRNYDVPVNYFIYDWSHDYIKTIINYLISDQYTWEDFELRVYIKQ